MASERFDRQLRLWGEAGQILIEECIVILDGIDGVNEEIAMSLCATGSGCLLSG
ncbi:putative ubiquitin domain protein [Gregarina niphandrodes]|uniref:Ubiquitin domain protein n=1 Tax=Gregarina niphandrodes TaxID=110365 RepID=A0A023B0R0_GRENI|nr:putative ubiquitin domain protein [Gregarina niphandrodes]EZG45801.1 putative ubiquitin domain protein [Gregarina niphandrodes]|eukprot:XP_011132438.1 putative ubiquitin domain protein [Gregarina niphandrodes]